MADQLTLIILVVALATGLVTSIVTASHMQARQPVFFRLFLTNILLFNLLILAGLVLRYLQIQLQSPALQAYVFVLPGMLVIMAALKLGWLFAFILMNKTLPTDVVPNHRVNKLSAVAAIAFLAYLGAMTTAWFSANFILQQVANIGLETLVVGGALTATLQLMLTAIRMPRGSRRRSVLTFSIYHLVLLGVILTVLVLGWLQPGPQRLAQLLANGGFLVLFNLFPLIWMRWFQPLQPVSQLEKFDSYGISKREREIIGLVQAGLTNQEIADRLFVSVATVKDHNHNIFRKCQVRNRTELANLFQ